MERREIILAGAGGQGLLFAGAILGEAAVVYENRYATQTSSYGFASRGGFCRSDIIVSDTPIVYPYVRQPDVVLALSREAYERYRYLSGSGCSVVYDLELTRGEGVPGEFGVPLSGQFSQGSATLAGLGVVVGICRAVTPGALEAALLSRSGPKAREVNQRAFRAGVEVGLGLRRRPV